MNTDKLLLDTLLDRPLHILIQGQAYALRPPTLGAILLAEEALHRGGVWDITQGLETEQRVALLIERSPRSAAEYLAYHLLPRGVAQDEVAAGGLATKLEDALGASELAALLLLALERDPLPRLIQDLGIAEDVAQRQRAQRQRGELDGWLTTGGRSIYGAIIDPLAERYGWQLDYILWGVSYANLRLLLADQITSTYLGEGGGGRMIRADDPANEALLEQLLTD